MTKTQARYLSFILFYQQRHNVPPSQNDIAEAMDVKPPSVHGMLTTLEKKGLIERQPRISRAVTVLADPATIPAWDGPPPPAPQIWVWSRSEPLRRSRAVVTAEDSEPIYRLRVSLVGSEPEIWRRFETTDVSLCELHEQIQTAMGWTNSHLHEFQIGKKRDAPRYMSSELIDSLGVEDTLPSDDIYLSALVEQFGKKLSMRYLYDFGDSWEHAVKFEKVLCSRPGQTFPRCIDGARVCPPEDIGGVWGYEELLAAIQDPACQQDEMYQEWAVGFDPEAFDPEKRTQAMQAGLPAW